MPYDLLRPDLLCRFGSTNGYSPADLHDGRKLLPILQYARVLGIVNPANADNGSITYELLVESRGRKTCRCTLAIQIIEVHLLLHGRTYCCYTTISIF